MLLGGRKLIVVFFGRVSLCGKWGIIEWIFAGRNEHIGCGYSVFVPAITTASSPKRSVADSIFNQDTSE